MSDFEEEFEIPASSEVDPAAEFLAKEQAELGDIGEDLGIAPAASQLTDNDNFLNEGENDLFSAAPTTVSLSAGDDNPFLLADTDSLTLTEVVDLVIYHHQTDFYTRHTISARFQHVLKSQADSWIQV